MSLLDIVKSENRKILVGKSFIVYESEKGLFVGRTKLAFDGKIDLSLLELKGLDSGKINADGEDVLVDIKSGAVEYNFKYKIEKVEESFSKYENMIKEMLEVKEIDKRLYSDLKMLSTIDAPVIIQDNVVLQMTSTLCFVGIGYKEVKDFKFANVSFVNNVSEKVRLKVDDFIKVLDGSDYIQMPAYNVAGNVTGMNMLSRAGIAVLENKFKVQDIVWMSVDKWKDIFEKFNVVRVGFVEDTIALKFVKGKIEVKLKAIHSRALASASISQEVTNCNNFQVRFDDLKKVIDVMGEGELGFLFPSENRTMFAVVDKTLQRLFFIAYKIDRDK